jgi:hypothetical protein
MSSSYLILVKWLVLALKHPVAPKASGLVPTVPVMLSKNYDVPQSEKFWEATGRFPANFH